MLDQDDLWLIDDEDAPLEEPSDLLKTMPEIRQYLDPEPRSVDVGIRSVLESPEALSKAWWRSKGKRRPRSTRRRARMLDAA